MNAKLLTCKQDVDLVRVADEWCSLKIRQYQAKSLFLPAGRSPQPIYQAWEKDRPAYLKGLELLQVDDVVRGPKAGLFREFFKTALPHFSVVPVQEEREGADLAILGVGLNGHVAFHEPGLAFSTFKTRVTLTESTCRALGVPPLTEGMTYGLGAFLKTKSVLLLFVGEKKKAIYEDFISQRRRGHPVEGLLGHGDLTVAVQI